MERSNPDISISRQCQLLGLPRSSYYYRHTGENNLNLTLMRLLDEQYTRTPFYGSPRMTLWLKSQGYDINHKRVERLMRVMGLQAVYPKPNTSKPCPAHKIYPYLLRDVQIDHVDQVWSADITYIRLRGGFLYLVAIMDWFSRYCHGSGQTVPVGVGSKPAIFILSDFHYTSFSDFNKTLIIMILISHSLPVAQPDS